MFHRWQVDYACMQARREPRQPPMLRPCVICGMPVDLVAVARERFADQRLHR